MNKTHSLLRPGCARTAGVLLLVRLLLISIVLISLNAVFFQIGETTLDAAIAVKTNLLLLISILVSIFFLTLLSIIVGFPLNNVFKSVDKNLSSFVPRLRVIEAFIFVTGMALLFLEVTFFDLVLVVGQLLYAIQLIILGYLVYKSGYLHQLLGISLVISSLFGYVFEAITRFYLRSFALIAAMGSSIAVISEMILAAFLVVKGRKMIDGGSDPIATVTKILEDFDEATTEEIIGEASKVSVACGDRIPSVLVSLEKEGKVTKSISKEKRALVWKLIR